jgi:hypothetical protein
MANFIETGTLAGPMSDEKPLPAGANPNLIPNLTAARWNEIRQALIDTRGALFNGALSGITAENMYPDTATALAAVAEGGYFTVPSFTETESLILYRKVSAAAQEISRYPSALIVAAAESARDAASASATSAQEAELGAVAAGKVYPDTASGIAGEPEGGYFSVPSPSATESFILYRKEGGLAVEKKRYSATGAAAAAPVVPSLPASAVSIFDGGNRNPCWLSADRRTLFSRGTNTLYASTDEGVTWSVLKGGFAAPINGVRDLANGELLVSLVATGGVPGSLWLSSGYPQRGASATWTKVLDAGAGGVGPSSAFDGLWGMSTHENIVVVSEYGLQSPPTDSSRFVYLSTDYGQTWTQIFDLGTNPSAHIHGVAYDPWWDAIWLVNGDTAANRATRVSFDRGQSWTVVSTATQYVAVIPLPNCILFTTDGSPNGVHRIERTADRTVPAPVVAHALDASPLQTYVGGMPYRAPGIDMPVLLPFVTSSVAGYAGTVLATYDGYKFTRLWTDSQTYAVKGPQTVLGPTAGGQYVGTLIDNRQANASRWVMPAAPTIATRGVREEVGTSVAAALRGLTMSPPGQYVTSPATTVSASTRGDAILYLTPIYIPRAVILDRIAIETTVAGSAGSVIRLGIYAANEYGAPGALVLDAGTVDATAAPGVLEAATDVRAGPGLYYLAAASQGAPTTPPTMRLHGGLMPGIAYGVAATLSAGFVGYLKTGIPGALPPTVIPGGTTGNTPRVLIRIQA